MKDMRRKSQEKSKNYCVGPKKIGENESTSILGEDEDGLVGWGELS